MVEDAENGRTPRPWWFHWLTNVGFALVAGLPFLFGAGGDAFLILVAALILGLVLVPITRRWEDQGETGRGPDDQ